MKKLYINSLLTLPDSNQKTKTKKALIIMAVLIIIECSSLCLIMKKWQKNHWLKIELVKLAFIEKSSLLDESQKQKINKNLTQYKTAYQSIISLTEGGILPKSIKFICKKHHINIKNFQYKNNTISLSIAGGNNDFIIFLSRIFSSFPQLYLQELSIENKSLNVAFTTNGFEHYPNSITLHEFKKLRFLHISRRKTRQNFLNKSGAIVFNRLPLKNIRLVGIIKEGDQAIAILENNNKETKVVEIGDKIGQQQYQLTAIENSFISLKKRGIKKKIRPQKTKTQELL